MQTSPLPPAVARGADASDPLPACQQQALQYIATGVSVLLGTLNMDLYIAITTGAVSLLMGIIEYQKLEQTIVCLNASSMQLSHLLLWW